MSYKFKHAILGGTFDHFHKGHKHFLDKAFSESERVSIGLTTSKLTKDKLFFSIIENYKTREIALKNYLEEEDFLKRTKIVPLNDIYGISLTTKNIDSIFVTDIGFKNAEKINKKRKKMQFPLLKIVKVPTIMGNDGEIISSTRIRSGEIDKEGHSYLLIFKETKEFLLPDFLRDALKKPAGKIINNIDELSRLNPSNFIISVGDIVTAYLIRNKRQADISIYDLKTKRQQITDNDVLNLLPKPQKVLKNMHGTINCKTVSILHELIEKSILTNEKAAIKIIGEEDLLTLPAILLAPLGSAVLYGISGTGMIKVVVTEEKKKEMEEKYLSKFEKLT